VFVEGLVGSNQEYPAFANAGKMDRVQGYITQQTGVTLGRPQDRLPGEVMIGQGDFIVFNRFKDGVPGHVIFGRNLGAETWFYDPQAGTGVLLNEPSRHARIRSFPISMNGQDSVTANLVNVRSGA
jgi:hypothetical protein